MSPREFLESLLTNASNDVMQNVMRHTLGHKPYDNLDIFFFIAFNHFLPAMKDLEKLDHEKAVDLIKKCNYYAFTFADNMHHKIELAKATSKQEDGEKTMQHNLKLSKGKKHGI